MNKDFVDGDTYLKHLEGLLVEYQWVYDVKMTEIFLSDIASKFPTDWLEYLLENENYSRLTQLEFSKHCPQSLADFVTSCEKCSVTRNNEHTAKYGRLNKHMSPKKNHEVEELVDFVNKLAKQHNLMSVVDIGSGRGYVDLRLANEYAYDVLAIESQQSYHDSAKTIAPASATNIRYVTKTICDSAETAQFIADELGADEKCCLIGLHACGDLSPLTLDIFAQSSKVKAAVVLSCCYHKMSRNCSSEEDDWCYFPLSSAVRKWHLALRRKNPKWRLGPYGFRLAAQETKSRWCEQSSSDHKQHACRVWQRSLVEVYQSRHLDDRLVLPKKFPKTASFAEYVGATFPNAEQFEELMRIYEEHEHLLDMVEPLTALQVCLQSVLETLILMDRVLYMQENGFRTKLLPLFDDSVSPRNLAIVAEK